MNTKCTLLLLALSGPALTINSQQFNWATTTGNSNLDVVTDSQGNILSTGIFTGTKHFDPGPKSFSLTSQGSVDVVIFKQDPTGARIWAKSIGGKSREFPTAIDVDASDNVYVTGWLEDTTDMDPGPGTFTLSRSPAFERPYVLKLNSGGDFVWAKHIEADFTAFINDIRIKGNAIYVTGTYIGLTDFDMGPGTHTLNTGNHAIQRAFIAKYDLDGELLWVTDLGLGIGNCIGLDVAGIYVGSDNEDPSTAITIHKLLENGMVAWNQSVTCSGEIVIRSVAVEADGSVIATGALEGTADFDPGAGNNSHTSAGSFASDIFIFKWSAAGTFAWSKIIGSDGHDMGEEVRLDNLGNIWVAGAFNYTVDFDPSYKNDSIAGRAHSSFLLKLAPNGDHLWAGAMYVVLEGPHATKINGMHISSGNSIFLTGSHDPHMDADPGPGQYLLTDAGAFMIRLNGSAPTGLTTFPRSEQLQIFPNPFYREFFIHNQDDGSTLRLRDNLGRIIHVQTLNAGKNSIGVKLAPGIYTAEIITKGVTERRKIISD